MDIRQKEILNATVEQYINNGEPIGSHSLQKTKQFKVSSATLRNELKKLHDKGYLTQIHTSSGRIPTDRGYRFYVENIINTPSFSTNYHNTVDEFIWIGNTLQDVLDNVTRMMTTLTDYTTLITMPDMVVDTLKKIHFILVDIDTVLVILLNSIGGNNEVLLKISESVSQEDLDKLSRWLSDKLYGKPFQPLSKKQFEELRVDLPKMNKLMEEINVKLIKIVNERKVEHRLIKKGISKMLKLPDFENIEITKSVITALEENKLLLELFSNCIHKKGVRVIIGDENQIQSLQYCSLVLSPYSINEDAVGMIGVLGPKRMRYSSMVPLIKRLTESLTKFFKKKYLKYLSR